MSDSDTNSNRVACETCGSTDGVSYHGMDGTLLCWEHMLAANRIEDSHWRLAVWAWALDKAINVGEPTEDEIESLRHLLKWLEEQREQ